MGRIAVGGTGEDREAGANGRAGLGRLRGWLEPDIALHLRRCKENGRAVMP